MQCAPGIPFHFILSNWEVGLRNGEEKEKMYIGVHSPGVPPKPEHHWIPLQAVVE